MFQIYLHSPKLPQADYKRKQSCVIINHMATVLVVDDDQSLSRLYSDKLKKEGFTVFVANDGIEGLEHALSQHPELILLDVLMPKMDGISMLKELRTDSWGKNVPVIMFSNLKEIENIGEVRAMVQEYVVKVDIRLNDLVALIKRYTLDKK